MIFWHKVAHYYALLVSKFQVSNLKNKSFTAIKNFRRHLGLWSKPACFMCLPIISLSNQQFLNYNQDKLLFCANIGSQSAKFNWLWCTDWIMLLADYHWKVSSVGMVQVSRLKLHGIEHHMRRWCWNRTFNLLIFLSKFQLHADYEFIYVPQNSRRHVSSVGKILVYRQRVRAFGPRMCCWCENRTFNLLKMLSIVPEHELS